MTFAQMLAHLTDAAEGGRRLHLDGRKCVAVDVGALNAFLADYRRLDAEAREWHLVRSRGVLRPLPIRWELWREPIDAFDKLPPPPGVAEKTFETHPEAFRICGWRAYLGGIHVGQAYCRHGNTLDAKEWQVWTLPIDDVLSETFVGSMHGARVHVEERVAEWMRRAGLVAEPRDDGRKWTHEKRGTTYRELARGTLQNSGLPLVEGTPIVAYVGEDWRVWFRAEAEFEDGRFRPYDPAEEPFADGDT